MTNITNPILLSINDLVVFSLISEVIRSKLNTETAEDGDLFLRAFFPGVRMAVLVPVVERSIQDLGLSQKVRDSPFPN